MPKRSKKSANIPGNAKNQIEPLRRCYNIKSQKHPDARCPYPATQGDFCARHSKHPKRFQEKSPLIRAEPSSFGRIDHDSAEQIQRFWRRICPILRIRRQGFAATVPSLASNSTDVYSLDPVEQIPLLYRWSTIDSKKNIWLFDIRTLGMLHQQEQFKTLINPYTREPFSEETMNKYLKRVEWLRSKKYYVFHNDEQTLTSEQLWHQRVLDVFMKLDMLGYYTCLKWFEDLSNRELVRFYFELYELWFFRLGLTNEQKEQIHPQWSSGLFRYTPLELKNRHDRKWYQTLVLDTIDNLVTKGSAKENRSLGAMYVMTAFALASPDVRQHYHWLVLE